MKPHSRHFGERRFTSFMTLIDQSLTICVDSIETNCVCDPVRPQIGFGDPRVRNSVCTLIVFVDRSVSDSISLLTGEIMNWTLSNEREFPRHKGKTPIPSLCVYRILRGFSKK